MEKNINDMSVDEMKEYLAGYYKEKISEFCKGRSLEEQVRFIRQCRELYLSMEEYVNGLGGTTEFGKITPDGFEYSMKPLYTLQWIDSSFKFKLEEKKDV